MTNMRAVQVLSVLLAILGTAASGAQVPGEWASTNAAGIAQWKKASGASRGFVVDAARRTLTVLAEATGLKAGETVEFFAIGPDSDRAYESLFVLAEPVRDIAEAAEAAGLPRGRCVSEREVRLWPQGERVSLSVRRVGERRSVPWWETLCDLRTNDLPALAETPLLYAGGRDAARGRSFFSAYSHNESLLQLSGRHEQSAVYGRLRPAAEWRRGDLFELEFAWGERRRVEERTVEIAPETDLRAALDGLRAAGAGRDLYVRTAFADGVTLARAAECARAFRLLDGGAVKMNGVATNQFFYGAFLPEEAWRERAGRMFQPFEIRLTRTADGGWRKTFTFIEEDWSGDGDDPVLVPHERAFADWAEVPGAVAASGSAADKIAVAFVFAPADAPLSALRPALALRPRINTFYLFPEK